MFLYLKIIVVFTLCQENFGLEQPETITEFYSQPESGRAQSDQIYLTSPEHKAQRTLPNLGAERSSESEGEGICPRLNFLQI